jgi:hypothetical protein
MSLPIHDRPRADRSPSTRVVLLVVGLVLVLVAAVAASVAVGRSRTATASSAGSTSAGAVPPEPAVVGQAANGTTIQLRRGQTLRVVLGSPTTAGSVSWSFLPPTSPVLAPLTAATVTPDHSAPGCARPGTGCGTVALTLAARTPGTTAVTASRTSCGEALRCTAAQSRFVLTVVVAG